MQLPVERQPRPHELASLAQNLLEERYGPLHFSSEGSATGRLWSFPSSQYTTMWAPSGIFDKNATVNPLARANKVYINYCSSDAFMGDRAASPATYGWAFRGQKIVEAVLKVGRGSRS